MIIAGTVKYQKSGAHGLEADLTVYVEVIPQSGESLLPLVRAAANTAVRDLVDNPQDWRMGSVDLEAK